MLVSSRQANNFRERLKSFSDYYTFQLFANPLSSFNYSDKISISRRFYSFHFWIIFNGRRDLLLIFHIRHGHIDFDLRLHCICMILRHNNQKIFSCNKIFFCSIFLCALGLCCQLLEFILEHADELLYSSGTRPPMFQLLYSLILPTSVRVSHYPKS